MGVDFRAIEGRYWQDLLGQPEALQDTLDSLDTSRPISDLAQQLQNGFFQRVVLTGMGSSFHALHPLNLQLIAHGFTSIMVETSELIHYQTRLFDPKTLLIAVSQSGQSAEMVRLAEVNRKRSAIIGVTNTLESTLAKQATAAVFTRAGHEFSVSCKTYVSAVVVLKWLGDILCQRDPEQSRRELANAVPAVSAYLANWKDHVISLVASLKGIRQLFLVGRGSSLAAVETGALIVKESDHFHAEGMSSAAFRHGPLEMLSQDMFVVVFSGDDKTRDLNARLLSDIRQGGARAEILGEETDLECFRLNAEDSSIRPVLEILPVQMITLALAVLAGREPGKFELASKITTTE